MCLMCAVGEREIQLVYKQQKMLTNLSYSKYNLSLAPIEATTERSVNDRD